MAVKKKKPTKKQLLRAAELSCGSKASMIAELAKMIGYKIRYRELKAYIAKYEEIAVELNDRVEEIKEEQMEYLKSALMSLTSEKQYKEITITTTQVKNKKGEWVEVKKEKKANVKFAFPNITAIKAMQQGLQNGDFNEHLNIKLEGKKISVDDLTEEERAAVLQYEYNELMKKIEK